MSFSSVFILNLIPAGQADGGGILHVTVRHGVGRLTGVLSFERES
ncbi:MULTISPECIES: hypothetical protein [Acetobacteraceae]|nr:MULTISPECIES: hypothetical protein [Acetobacteraceae]